MEIRRECCFVYLKKIIAHGFKSFADNITIDFDNSIVGIVGPNGSGKSNIVDAIRWVLGEQSIKSLRGNNLTDVIFAGSKSRNPMNAASVTLIFDNKDNYIPISYDEVAIKRRLYKDGTNEYFLNGEKVRLKDINNILMDSGIAKESFNIISQGKIEEILDSKPENRRIIFEEAAGVIKYKKRKEEAFRKLDRTYENMTRVNDIINELETQIVPLKEQREAAIQYQELSEQLKKLEIALIVADITNINDKYHHNKQEIEKLSNNLTNIKVDNNKNETQIIKLKVDITKNEEQLKELQQQLIDITKETEQLKSQKNIIIERQKYQVEDYKLHNNIISLKEEEYKLKNDITILEEEIKIKLQDLENLDKKIEIETANNNKLKKEKDDINNKLNIQLKLENRLNNDIDLLKENIESNANLPYSVKKILENPKLNGIYDTVGNIIEVEELYSKAISIALSANISNIVVENENCAKEAINYLKENKLGRATFFPINVIKPKYIPDNIINTVKIDGFIDIASNLVKYDNKYDNILKNLLGNILIVNNIEVANKISKMINHSYRVVTLDGEIIHVGGSLTGGTLKSKNIILDKYELEEKLKKKNECLENVKLLEDKINIIDEKIANIIDKLYLLNKDKMLLKEAIKQKEETKENNNNRLHDILNEISGTNNIINDSLINEEEEIIQKYYNAEKRKEEINQKIELANRTKIELKDTLDNMEYILKKDNNQYQETNNLLKNLEIEVNRYDVKLDNLLNILNEEYTITYEKAKSIYQLDIEEKDARIKVNDLKKKIKNLGIINIGAITEYDRISERYEFLLNQHNDLVNAKNTLINIIEDMDKTMQKEFLTTFNVIANNFQETFKELFKGGEARLELTDKENILETGIDIIASPPGKTLKNINLLSGGEKTFTAISLLFAILKSRIMPFCVLDEVEASLDEVNVQAFGEYLLKLKDKTQFIVITHKKKTMEYANILYGITMQESGISKLGSVKLDNIEA